MSSQHLNGDGSVTADLDIRVLETTDLHMQISDYDYYADRRTGHGGLGRLGRMIGAARCEVANTLLFDDGDSLQGNPMGDYLALEDGLEAGALHPMIAAMNALKYDAITLGNHDFNYGVDFLSRSLKKAQFPVVSCNVMLAGADQAYFALPHTLLERQMRDTEGRIHNLRIGVIGSTPPQISAWDKRLLSGRIETCNVVSAMRGCVEHLQAQGVDLVIALCHSGIGGKDSMGADNGTHPVEDNIADLVARIDGIDVILAGHQHFVFPGPWPFGESAPETGIDAERGTLHGKPFVMAGFGGSHLGVIDLRLRCGPEGWKIIHHSQEARPVTSAAADAPDTRAPDEPQEGTAAQSFRRAHRATLTYVRRPVGKTTVPLHSYFSLVAPDAALGIIADAQAWYIADQLRGTTDANLPLLSAVSPYKSGGRSGAGNYTNIPVGEIAIRNVADLYPFPNEVHAVRLSGLQLSHWLERSAGMFRQIHPGAQDQPLIDPDFPGYYFDVIEGLQYSIDLSRPTKIDIHGHQRHNDAGRIYELSFEGQPLLPDDHFIVATNSFRSSDPRLFLPGPPQDTVISARVSTCDALIRYISAKKTVARHPSETWSFRAMPGTSASFESSPDAPAHLGTVRGRNITHTGTTTNGFARFRLSL